MNKIINFLLVFCSVISCVKSFDYINDNICKHAHYELEIKLLVTYFQEAFYIAIVDTDVEHEHRISALKCLKMDKYTRPFMIYNSIKKIKFSTPPNNSSLTSFSQIFGYYVKANHSETFEFFEKMSQQNPLTKVMIQLTDDSEETSSIVLQTAYDKFKMLNVATLHRKIKFASLKFYNPFKNRGEFYTINVTRQSVLTEIKKYQNDRIWNLHRFPLRIYIFDSPMSVKKVTLDKTSKIKFIYTDGELANMLSEKMNFTAIYVLSNDEISHNGYLMENGSFSGGIGAIEKNRADLLMNPRLITDLNTTRATFLQPLSTYSYKFVIKRLERDRVLPLTIFEFYDIPSQIITISLIILFPIIYMIINNLERLLFAYNKEGSKQKRKCSIFNYSIYIFALYNNVSMRQTHIAPPISRIIIFVIIFYALFVSSVFQGSIVKDLNAQTKITKINDVEDLFSADYKFVMNHMLHTVFKQQKGNELSKNLRKIAANAKTTIGNEEGLKILLKEKKYACLLDSLYVTTNYLNRYYDNKTGENLLEIVPEKAFEFYVAVMASRDSPFILSLNQNILRWVEGGFDYYHIHKATHDNYINIFYEKHKKGLTSHSKFKSLSIDDLKSVFILYGYMIAVCIIIALLEISYFYISTMNKPKKSMNFVI